MSEQAIVLNELTKHYGKHRGINNLSFSVNQGELFGFIGPNGAGKSTTIRTLMGLIRPTGGSASIFDLDCHSKASVIARDVGYLPSENSYYENMKVRELLQYTADLYGMDCKTKMKELADRLNLDLSRKIADLSLGNKKKVGIVSAIMTSPKLIIMDEPTTALTKKEVNRLFEIIADLKKNGVTILFVSHKLDEVFEISDSITILRSGENVISCPTSEMTEEKFAYYMTGRHFDTQMEKVTNKDQIGDVVLEAKNLSAPGFEDVSFQLRKGEILGVTGQLGSGRTELSLALFGMLKPTGGQILVDGKEVHIGSVAAAQKLGIALVPEDRLTEGLFLPQSIIRNNTVSILDRLANKIGFLSNKKVVDESSRLVKELGVATKDHTLPVQTLSGGNQQKVVLARWLASNPKVLILNGPTVGVDIGAKYDIHNLLRQLAASGMAILVVSDDTSEVIATCDRAIVMQAGRVTGNLSESDLNADTLAKAAL